ncbi:MAG TPA: diaminopimelate epimerase [Flavihumibacter sp.]|nr:diaminopimelate epimerase [Bacteroidota bacterium]HOA39320.1 diaminopimelate epimerase [Flavihumibacter sp.]HPZ88046.1 diaminopimelate epimerase [Flavihumibacter sp.]HQD09364.1 diaminopimelate epimerase [Flavihumibacter sp.]
MTQLHFFKYQGTGNDFVILDNRAGEYEDITTAQVHQLCDRRFGIGADGLMLLNKHANYDFAMKYYNADGQEGSMCGNGGRCLVKFAFDCGLGRSTYRFIAVDGEHEAEIDTQSRVRLKMQDVSSITEVNDDAVLNTGSPHYVKMVTNLLTYDVYNKGKEIRYNALFQPGGINVNFVETQDDDEIMVRTFERGVEDETLSCGTGVTAAALVNYHNDLGFNQVKVTTRGGKLWVEFDRHEDGSYTNIWLCGPAEKVFQGAISLA